MFKSLHSQWLIAFIGVAFFVVAIISGAAWFAANQQTQRRVESRLNTIAHELRRLNFPLTASILKTMESLTEAHFVLVDPDGKVILTSDPSDVDWSRVPVPASLLQSDKPLVRGPLDVPGAGRFDATWARFLTSDARTTQGPARWVGILLSDADVRQMQRQAFLLPLLTGCSTALALGAIATILNVNFVKRIKALQHQVARIARGNFESIPLQRPLDELSSLAIEVNAMANDLRMMESKIHQAERERLVQQTADGIAHDLRNTLTGARLALQLHAKSCTAGDREALDVSTRQLHLAEDQIQRWLRDDRMSEPHGPTAFADIFDAAIQLARPTAEHLQVALQIERDPLLETKATLDSGSLQSAVLNLLMNAIQAAGAGGTVQIKTICINKDGCMEGQIRIIDDGPGPNAEIATRIFEPFVTTKPEGVGMGLALVERTARKMGGTVGWQRIDGRTIFTLKIPVNLSVPREADASAIHRCASGEDDEPDTDRR